MDRSISKKAIEEGRRFISRVYRNRRLGEFLKELELSEGHSTGIPTIQDELAKNGSPKAVFHTDDDRRAVRVEIPIHPDFKKNKRSNDPINDPTNDPIKSNSEFSDIEKKVLKVIEIHPTFSRFKIAEEIGCSESAVKRAVSTLKKKGVIERQGSRKTGSWVIINK